MHEKHWVRLTAVLLAACIGLVSWIGSHVEARVTVIETVHQQIFQALGRIEGKLDQMNERPR